MKPRWEATVARPVLVMGDLNADLVLGIPDRTVPTGERTVPEPRLFGGGTAGNTAAALGRLGVPVEFAGAIGDDGFGRHLAAELASAGVGLRGLVVSDAAPTCQVIAMVEPDGERYLVVWPGDMGALRHLRAGDVDPALVEGAAWLHTTGMCLRHPPVRDAVLAALRIARAAGVPSSLDLNLRIEVWGLSDEVRAVVEAAVHEASVVLGSAAEELVPLARALGLPVTPAGDPHAAALALARPGSGRTVIGRLGAGGAFAALPDGTIVHAPGFPVEVRSTVGAGDAFDAGLVAALVAGLPMADALRWGNATGALKVARNGGARDQPTRAEVEALLAG